VIRRLDDEVAAETAFLIGDANGVDKAVQRHLDSRHYQNVEIFRSGPECRNNLGHWPERHSATTAKRKTFDFHAAKDRTMAQEASGGLLIWDGESVGTLMSARRLLHQGKPVDVYLVREDDWRRVLNEVDWSGLMSLPSEEARMRLEDIVAAEGKQARQRSQLSFL
jgi:hypothetical protein